MLGEKHETKHYQGLEIKIRINPISNLDLRGFNFICCSNGLKIGHCYLRYFYQTKRVSIRNFYIEEPYRWKGYGSKLWKFVEKYMKKSYKPNKFYGDISEVDNFNVASSFWHKMGFKIIVNQISKSAS